MSFLHRFKLAGLCLEFHFILLPKNTFYRHNTRPLPISDRMTCCTPYMANYENGFKSNLNLYYGFWF